MKPTTSFLGVYSAKKSPKSRKGRELFFVWQARDQTGASFYAQAISESFVPTGKVIAIDVSTLNILTYEPSILAAPLVTPEEIVDIRRGKKPYEQQEEPSPPPVRENTARETERQMRREFGSALKNLDKPRERSGAIRFIKTIPNQSNLTPSHSHMLRDFCTELRKQRLPEIALMFASKTVELVPGDDHAHFNLARIYCILERYKDAIKEVHEAIGLGATEEDEYIYQKMLHFIEKEEMRHISPRELAMQRARERAKNV
ncbi:MAG: hypothetical protein K5657_00975 [Desulfovibrio sp.]|nr:hypothetical protein [Desulfovibrio sp.]